MGSGPAESDVSEFEVLRGGNVILYAEATACKV